MSVSLYDALCVSCAALASRPVSATGILISSYPNPNVVKDSDGADVALNGECVILWDTPGLGAIPTATALAVVTADQVTALRTGQMRTAGSGAVLFANDPVAVGSRGSDSYAFTHINDVAEALWAVTQLVCARAGITLPTKADIQAQITSNRSGLTIPAGTPDPATVADYGTRRIDQTAIVTEIQALIAAGGGDPLA
jgi:hypothetical protein